MAPAAGHAPCETIRSLEFMANLCVRAATGQWLATS